MLSFSKKNKLEGKGNGGGAKSVAEKCFKKMTIKSKLDGCTAFSFVKLGQDKWKNMNVSCSSFKIKHMQNLHSP